MTLCFRKVDMVPISKVRRGAISCSLSLLLCVSSAVLSRGQSPLPPELKGAPKPTPVVTEEDRELGKVVDGILKRQDEEYFGGQREAVLTRDGNRCAVPGCTTLKRGKRSIAVHHRKPGTSDPKLMITLCLACHAKVTRTGSGLRYCERSGENSTPRGMNRRY